MGKKKIVEKTAVATEEKTQAPCEKCPDNADGCGSPEDQSDCAEALGEASSVCDKTDCKNFDSSESNHCVFYEHIFECDDSYKEPNGNDGNDTAIDLGHDCDACDQAATCPGPEDCYRNNMIDASSSIPEKDEAFHFDLPTSEEFRKGLPVFLTPVELGEYSHRQADLWLEWGRLNQQKKDSAAVYKKKIDDIEERLDEISRVVNEGSAERSVMCKYFYDYAKNEKILIRLDLNEEVERVTLTKEEIERYQNPELFSSVTGDPPSEVVEVSTEAVEDSQDGETEAEDSISVSDVSIVVEETMGGFPELSKDGLDANIVIAPKDEIPVKCCMPKDRTFARDGDIRIMYCQVCRRVIKKEDTSIQPFKNIDVAEGELFEGGEEP